MMKQLKIVVNVAKGSPLTGTAWVDILFNGIRQIDQAVVDSAFDPTGNGKLNSIEFEVEYNDEFQNTLTVINHPNTIGPIQIYGISFYVDGVHAPLTWQTAIKGKPVRFGGQPNVTITNPHVNDPDLSGWCSVPDVSPGMSITWGLSDLVHSVGR